LEYFLVSESVAVDTLTNRISIFNVLETIRARRLPAVYPVVHAVSVWLVDESDRGGDYQVTVRVTMPGGNLMEYPMNFVPQARRHRLFQRIQGIPVPQTGTIEFELLLNGVHVARHLVDAELVPETLRPATDDQESHSD
jgi:hypothetical protein